MPDKPNHPVAASRQKRRQCRADQTGRARDGHDERSQARIARVAVRGQVVGELTVPVDERRAQGRCGHRRVDAVVHPRPVGRLAELVRVCPAPDDAWGPRPGALRGEHVDEAVRRVETRRIVRSHPAQPTGQAEHRPPVCQ